MSETIETKKFLGMEGVNALLEGLKGEYSPLEHVHSWEELEEKPFYEERTETPVFENVTGSWNIGERPAVNIDPSVIINTGTTYKIICTSDFYGTSVTEIHEIVAENNVLNFTIDGFPAYIDGGKIRVEDNSVSGSLDVSHVSTRNSSQILFLVQTTLTKQ